VTLGPRIRTSSADPQFLGDTLRAEPVLRRVAEELRIREACR